MLLTKDDSINMQILIPSSFIIRRNKCFKKYIYENYLFPVFNLSPNWFYWITVMTRKYILIAPYIQIQMFI